MPSPNHNFPFGLGFNFATDSVFSPYIFNAGYTPMPFPPVAGNFELLDGTDFLLLDGTNFLLL